MKRAAISRLIVVALASGLLLASEEDPIGAAEESADQRKIPVIFDTDIGGDIDDTWALALLLKCPELDVKLVVGDHGSPVYRASLLAKLLETAGRTDIPVGVGIGDDRRIAGPQADWLKGYDLASYPGKVYEDGVQAMIHTIMKSPEPITVIAVGPLPNMQEALKREPRIADKARFVGMHGSVRKGYGGSVKISAEWNVRADAKACRATLSAPWDITITPLDTCGLVHLRGEKYAAVRNCKEPLIEALVQNYRVWWKNNNGYKNDPQRAEKASSTLFDTVAVYLAFSQELCKMETLPIRVTDDGKTVIDASAKKMHVATDWKDLGAFEDFLVERLIGEQ
jgi:inosine-uridine nucleoside N-ribohydrolase